MTLKPALLMLLLCCSLMIRAQDRHILSGYVRDGASGESLIGASISVPDLQTGVTTNAYGFYSLKLPEGAVRILVSYTGYRTVDTVLLLSRTEELDFPLFALSRLDEVVVTAERQDGHVTSPQMGKISLPLSRIRAVPVLLGEVDLLKTLQLLPGVRNAGEGNTGLYVRGGGPDQNLILLDDAVVYNTGHLFGFFSIFNADAIKHVSLIKGSFPAQYGGRLSSVLDVAMKEGNLRDYEVEGGIGLIASRVSVQGPLKKDKASFIVSGRRTYVDLLTRPFIGKQSNFYGSGYYFYDLNAKVNYIISPRDRIYLSGYFGRDVFSFKNAERSFRADIPWGNSTATLRWNHVFSGNLFANSSLVYNDYQFSFGAVQQDFAIRLASGVRDWTAKTDFDWYPSPGHRIRYGGLFTLHGFVPNVLAGQQGPTVFQPNNAPRKHAAEWAGYLQDEWKLSERFRINAGIRYSRFAQLGPYVRYGRDADGNRTDSTVYERGERVQVYDGWEPRMTLQAQLDERSSFKAGIARNMQYIHLVSNAGTTLPTDLWVPSTHRVRPQVSWQYAASFNRSILDGALETSIELYYKDMRNQIEYREGYTPSLRDPEEEFVFGRGYSYGAEFFANKVRGRFSGWAGYTLSWTWRKFPDLNGGEAFPAKYDRRHDLSLVGSYELNSKWKISAAFVFGSGNAATLPERFYLLEGVLIQEYGRLNTYRLPAYHRLDLSATYTPPRNAIRKWKTSWVFGLYNTYSRLNPYFVYFDQQGSATAGDLQMEARQVSIFPLIPSVTWNFRL